MLERGAAANAIALILSGKVQATRDKQILGDLGGGSIVGFAIICRVPRRTWTPLP